MQADIFKDILVPVIGGLGIFMLGPRIHGERHPGARGQQDAGVAGEGRRHADQRASLPAR